MNKEIIDYTDSKNVIDEMGNSSSIESTFSTYLLLDIFFSPILIHKTKSFYNQLTKKDAQEGLRQGYKLLLVAVLDNYLDSIIRSPETLGIQPDLDYRDYWAYTKGQGREITKGTPRTEHQISKFVAKANMIINGVLSQNTWDSIEVFGESTNSFRRCLQTISEKSYRATKGKRNVSMHNKDLNGKTIYEPLSLH